METQIAACGLVCSRCDAFRATLENSEEKLELVAADWRERYNCQAIAASNIRCNGCMSEGGPKSGHCSDGCEVRKCALKRKLSSCGDCAELESCETLKTLHSYMNETQSSGQRELLRAVRKVESAMHSAF